MSSIPPDFNKNGFPSGDMGGYSVNEFAPHQQYAQYCANSPYPAMHRHGEYAHQTVNNQFGNTYFPELDQIDRNYMQRPKHCFDEAIMNQTNQKEYLMHNSIPLESQSNVHANNYYNGPEGQYGQVVKAAEAPQAFPCIETAFNQLTTTPATPVAPMMPVCPAVDNSNLQSIALSEVLQPVSDMDELSNSTTPDSDPLSTESNSPSHKDDPILSPIVVAQNQKEEEAEEVEEKESAKLTPEEPKLTKAEWIQACQMECSFSEVLSQSYFDPAPETHDVGTEITVEDAVDASKEEKEGFVKTRRLIETDDEEDTRAEDFWNDPALESFEPRSSAVEKIKGTKRVKDTEDHSLYDRSVADVNLDVSDDDDYMEPSRKPQSRKRKNKTSAATTHTKKRKPNKNKITVREAQEHAAKLKQMKKSFRQASLEFKFEADLEYALKTYGHKYPSELIDKVSEYLDKKKQNREDPHYLRTPIDFSAVFPDHENYRHCNEYRKRMTSTWKVPSNTRRRSNKMPTQAPPLSLCGTLYTDLNASAHDVYEHVKNWYEKCQNDIYMKSDPFTSPEPDTNLAELERQFYQEKYGDTQMEQFVGEERNRIQTPVLTVTSKSDLEDPNLKRILNSASITVVSGICEAAGIDPSLFAIEALIKLHEDLMVDCLFQNPQSADNNYDSDGNKTWQTSGMRTEKPFSWFVKYMHRRYQHCERYLARMVDSDCFEATEADILKKMIKEQKDFAELDKEEEELTEMDDPSMYWTCFGTNIDLQSREVFTEQHEHLDKLPEFLRPRFEGNLLGMIGEDVLGINTVQVYSKPPGSRTAAHMENSLMASININLGPGECVWFAVPYEYWGRIAGMVEARNLKYHLQNYWPDENELRAAGIPVQKFLQKPDEMVYVNTGCFHWVQSAGYCVNVSWNVGQPTGLQMSTSLIAAQHNLLSNYQSHIPICKIAWNIAKNKLFMDDTVMYETVRAILIRTFAYSAWYEEEITINKKIVVKKEDLQFTMFAVLRCMECSSEVFNVIRWYLGTDTTYFCRKCTPSPKNTVNRYEAFSVLISREEMMEIMDGYKRPSVSSPPAIQF